MTDLAGLASTAVVAACGLVRFWLSGNLLVAIRHGLGSFKSLIWVLKRGCRRRFMCVGSSCFCSDCDAGHLNSHHVTGPAAQGQQDDHEGED